MSVQHQGDENEHASNPLDRPAGTLHGRDGLRQEGSENQRRRTPNRSPTPPPATDVNPQARPAVVDPTENDPLKDPDLAKINDYLVKQGLLGDVFFEYDKADLRDDARARLASNAEWLRAHPEFEVTIEGHCDERGTNEYNLALGARRSGSARDYITSLGVAASQDALDQLRRGASAVHLQHRELLVDEPQGALRRHRTHERRLRCDRCPE